MSVSEELLCFSLSAEPLIDLVFDFWCLLDCPACLVYPVLAFLTHLTHLFAGD